MKLDLPTICLVTSILFLIQAARAVDIDLNGSADVTYMSRLMDKGGKYYGDEAALLQSVHLNIGDTGLGITVAHRSALGGEFAAKERIDYKIGYGNTVFDGEAFQVNYGMGWVYHHHHNGGSVYPNYHEWELSLKFPKLLPGGWVPSYKIAAEHGIGDTIADADFWHQFAISKSFEFESIPAPIGFFADIAYRDGLGGINAWTHVTVGLDTQFEIIESLSLASAVYHQFSLSDELTDEDVTYAVVSLKYDF
ncbi:MAG: hypothetical protein MK080_03310 [Opitutales bacterium]|nr:hypothetical protein [Opitutales bacterium]NRA26899.1 hypothetical protein [Opitutales bacterium]